MSCGSKTKRKTPSVVLTLFLKEESQKRKGKPRETNEHTFFDVKRSVTTSTGPSSKFHKRCMPCPFILPRG